jgi:hypothetical protein
LMLNSRILAPIIIKSEEASETTAIDTKSLMESMSEVRLVSNFEGLDC